MPAAWLASSFFKPINLLCSQFLQVGQPLACDSIFRIDLGEVSIDTAGLLILAHRLISLPKQIIGLIVIAVDGNQLLEGCHCFLDLLSIEVVASNHHLVLSRLL